MMKICFNMDPLTIDPRKNGDPVTSALHYMIFDGLIRMNVQGNFELALAKSVEIFDGGKTYEFTLRDAYWSNGDPIVAKDFEYSWKRSLHPSFPTPSPQLFFFLRNGEKARNGMVDFSEVGVQAIGPKKLKIDLENPCPHLFSLLSLCNLFPAPALLYHTRAETLNLDRAKAPGIGDRKSVHISNIDRLSIVDPRELSRGSKSRFVPECDIKHTVDGIDPLTIPISGPFQIISWKKREEICLQKNPLYWDAKNVALQELKIFICQNPYNILKMFHERKIDLISNLYCSLPNELIKEYIDEKIIKLISMGGTVFSAFNNSVFPFNNKNIRKAFSFAINRKEIAACFETPAQRILPPPLSHGVAKTLFRFDPQEARHYFKLGMKELGIFKDGNQEKLQMFFNKMVLHFEHSIPRTRIARKLQKQWKECLGIQVQLAPISYQEHINRFYEGDYSMQIGHWISQYMDPVSILERFKDPSIMKNYPRFEYPNYSTLVGKINEEFDPLLRAELILEAEELLTQEMPLAPLYHYSQVVVMHSELPGIAYLQNGALSFMACASDKNSDPKTWEDKSYPISATEAIVQCL
jgi:oligopeptide transport system substrate-binding protein